MSTEGSRKNYKPERYFRFYLIPDTATEKEMTEFEMNNCFLCGIIDDEGNNISNPLPDGSPSTTAYGRYIDHPDPDDKRKIYKIDCVLWCDMDNDGALVTDMCGGYIYETKDMSPEEIYRYLPSTYMLYADDIQYTEEEVKEMGFLPDEPK